MSSLAVYPSGDGYIYHESTGDTWSNIRNGAGTNVNNSATDGYLFDIASDSVTNQWDLLIRGGFGFLTSDLPDSGITIDSAIFSVRGVAKANTLGGSPTVNIYSFAPAAATALAAGDYDACGTDPYCSTALTYNEFSSAAYNDFSLNSTGIASISKTGYTYISSREATYDATGTEPSWVGSKTFRAEIYFNENGSLQPTLTITYSTALAAYTLTADKITYTYTLNDVALKRGLRLPAETITYTYTLNNTLFNKGYKLVADTISYTLTLTDTFFRKTWRLVADTISYALTLTDTSFKKSWKLIANTISYVLTLKDTLFKFTGWKNQSKNTATFTNETKNTATFSNETKNSSSWTNQDKS